MDAQLLADVLRLHGLWLNNEKDGVRANLSGANLAGADLAEANLTEAANHYLADEYSLHGFTHPPVITPGMVRCVWQALDDHLAAADTESLRRTPPEPIGEAPAQPALAEVVETTLDPHHLAPANGDGPHLDRVAAKIRKALERKAAKRPALLPTPVVTPDAAPEPSPTPAGHGYGFRSGLSVAQVRALALDDIRRIAGKDGIWVNTADFNAQRSSPLPTATAVVKRLDCTWSGLVRDALGERSVAPSPALRLPHLRRKADPPAPESAQEEAHHA